MIRPRGGDFLYSDSELLVMLEDISACAQLGVAGIVIGCLTPDGQVHEAQLKRLMSACLHHGLDVTFHRAFDMTRDLAEALEVLAANGVPRVLTSGGRAAAVEAQGVLAALVVQSAGRVSIMAGAGIGSACPPADLPRFIAATGVREVSPALQ